MSSCCRILWETLFQSDNLISEEIGNACHEDLRRDDKENHNPYSQRFDPCSIVRCSQGRWDLTACHCHLLLEMRILQPLGTELRQGKFRSHGRKDTNSPFFRIKITIVGESSQSFGQTSATNGSILLTYFLLIGFRWTRLVPQYSSSLSLRALWEAALGFQTVLCPIL